MVKEFFTVVFGSHMPGNTVTVGIGGLGVVVVCHSGTCVVVVKRAVVVVLRVVVVFRVIVRRVELTGRRLKTTNKFPTSNIAVRRRIAPCGNGSRSSYGPNRGWRLKRLQ